MFVIRKVFLLALFVLITVSFTGCFEQLELDPFGKEKKVEAVESTSEDGLKLINTHEQEYTSEHASQFSSEPQ